MARKSTLSLQEQREMEAANNRDNRNTGLKLMSVRDRGVGEIRNYNGDTAQIYWHVDRPLQEGEVRRHVPDGMLIIESGGTPLVLNAEELMKLARWA